MKAWELKYLFFDLFQALRRETGIELDLRQYALLIEALGRGIGTETNRQYSRAGLLALCKTLWLTHPRHETAFEQQFERFLRKYPSPFLWEEPPPKPAQKTDEPGPAAKVPEVAPPPSPAPSPPAGKGQPPGSKPQLPASQMQEWLVAFDLLESTADEASSGSVYNPLPDHRFVFSNKYFPVEERRLQHYWRHLRYRAEKRPGRALDLPGTIRQISRRGGDPQLVFQQETFYEEHFLFLLDRGGSMCAFEKFSDQLLNTVRESLRPQHLDVFYFHDLPTGLLYKDSVLTESLPAEEAFGKLSRHSLVFIVSDAGAARGENDKERAGKTLDLLQRLRARTPHLLWFNPMPRERWAGTPAFYIPLAAPMIELSESNLSRLPQLLRHF